MGAVLAKIKCKAGTSERFEGLIAEMVRLTKAGEPGCTRYEFWRARDPATYYVMECFVDVNGFFAHQASPHHSAMAPALVECFEDITVEWVDPVDSAHTRFPPTIDRPLAPDASARICQEKESFPVNEASWWHDLRSKYRRV